LAVVYLEWKVSFVAKYNAQKNGNCDNDGADDRWNVTSRHDITVLDFELSHVIVVRHASPLLEQAASVGWSTATAIGNGGDQRIYPPRGAAIVKPLTLNL
jgi:hypothetical protein